MDTIDAFGTIHAWVGFAVICVSLTIVTIIAIRAVTRVMIRFVLHFYNFFIFVLRHPL